jgi:pyruvate/2-oxoglutarate dehydrogenase complex dihydrolipoamide acyltransferase (E2) component
MSQVSTDNGLITPIVKDADLKGFAAISADVAALAAKARCASNRQPDRVRRVPYCAPC